MFIIYYTKGCLKKYIVSIILYVMPTTDYPRIPKTPLLEGFRGESYAVW